MGLGRCVKSCPLYAIHIVTVSYTHLDVYKRQPASLVSDTYEKDLSKYADQEIEFVITEFNPRRRRIIGNRKQLLLAEKAEKQKELLAKINVGDKVEGVVKNVTAVSYTHIC